MSCLRNLPSGKHKCGQAIQRIDAWAVKDLRWFSPLAAAACHADISEACGQASHGAGKVRQCLAELRAEKKEGAKKIDKECASALFEEEIERAHTPRTMDVAVKNNCAAELEKVCVE